MYRLRCSFPTLLLYIILHCLSIQSSTSPSCPNTFSLANKINGLVVSQSDSQYDTSRLDWNERIQPLPCVVVYCANVEDVKTSLSFASHHGIGVTVRSARHSYESLSVGTGGLVIDVGKFMGSSLVVFDDEARTATAPAGAQLISMYDEASRHGFGFPGGSCPTVGLGGFTLGGGYGFYSRLWGLSIDHVESFGVVLAHGEDVIASARSHPDLFWALRGGGNGNFGVITNITYGDLPNQPNGISMVQIEWPMKDAAHVIKAWQQFAPYTTPRLTSQLELYHNAIHSLGVLVNGTKEELIQWIQPLLDVGNPTISKLDEMEYMEGVVSLAGCNNISECLERTNNVPAPSGLKWKAKSSYVFEALDDQGIQTLIQMMTTRFRKCCAGQYAGVLFDSYGGRIADVDPNATAFYSRDALYHLQYMAYMAYDDEKGESQSLEWLRQFQSSMSTHLSPYSYRNYPDLDVFYAHNETSWLHVYHGSNAARLRRVKNMYDPNDVFRGNMTIRP